MPMINAIPRYVQTYEWKDQFASHLVLIWEKMKQQMVLVIG